MRPKFSFSNVIAFAALGALAVMVATDPRFRELLSGNWQWIGLLLAIIVLIMAQVILVRRSLYVLPAGRTSLAEPATPSTVQPSLQPPARQAPQDAAGTAGTSAPAGPATPAKSASPSTSPGDGEIPGGDPPSEARQDGTGEPGPNIDVNLFTRFRQHLESVENQDAQTPAPNRAPASEDEVEDRVELSPASRRKAAKGGAASKTDSGAGKKTASAAENYAAFVSGEDGQDGSDLFSDLRPQPVTPPAGEETSGNDKEARSGETAAETATKKDTETATGTAADSTTQTASDGKGENGEHGDSGKNGEHTAGAKPGASTDASADASGTDGGVDGRTASPDAHPSPGEAPQPPPDEVTDALAARAGDSPEKGKAELAEEAAALLHLAEEAGRRGVWERLRASLKNYLDHLADAPELVDWRARRLQVRLAVNDRATGPALQAFEEMLTAGYQPDVDVTPGLLEEMLDGGERKLADTLRVSMLVRILAAFRQRRDQPAMDRAYSWIEAAQERVGDEKRLLQYLKNHLEIRKAMDNVPGQLELIDQIGNRCFKLGLTDEARTYYEMGLKLRGGSEDDQAPTGDDDSAVG